MANKDGGGVDRSVALNGLGKDLESGIGISQRDFELCTRKLCFGNLAG